MDNLILRPGAHLVWRDLHREESEHPIDTDVGSRAIEFLFEPVTLDARLTLGDVFSLLEICPPLKQVFRREFADELCAEARKGSLPRSRGFDPAEAAGIEFLELSWSWRLDTSSNAYSGIHQLDLHGIGDATQADVAECGVNAGSPVRWAVSLMPLRELLDLPLRVRADFNVTEDDCDAKAYGHTIASGKCQDALLGQVIYSILWELSWHGGPESQAAFRDELVARVGEIDAGTAKLVPADEVPAKLDWPGFDMMFEPVEGVSREEIRRALRTIDDEEPVGPWLDREFHGKVRVKPQFRDRAARDFRRALRSAGR